MRLVRKGLQRPDALTANPTSANHNHPPPVKWGGRLFAVGAAILTGLAAYYGFHAQVRTTEHLLLGLVMLALAFLPALLWTRRGKPSLPVFESFLLTTLSTYALPLLNGHEELRNYGDTEITRAALAVILFQMAALSSYLWTPPVRNATMSSAAYSTNGYPWAWASTPPIRSWAPSRR